MRCLFSFVVVVALLLVGVIRTESAGEAEAAPPLLGGTEQQEGLVVEKTTFHLRANAEEEARRLAGITLSFDDGSSADDYEHEEVNTEGVAEAADDRNNLDGVTGEDQGSGENDEIDEYYTGDGTEFIESHTDPLPVPRDLPASPNRGVKDRRNAIVYFSDDEHGTPGNRESYGVLMQSIDLLFHNYLLVDEHWRNAYVFIFHTGNFQVSDLETIESRFPHETHGTVKLVNLRGSRYWKLPRWLNDEDPRLWDAHKVFALNHRHKTRFFAVNIYDYFRRLTYENPDGGAYIRYILKMEPNTYLWSRIEYDIFNEMLDKEYVYGFRSCSYEMRSAHRVWTSFTKQYPTEPRRDFDGRGLCGFANSFWVADMSFFWSPNVQHFLEWVDHTGVIYRMRLNDVVIQSMTVYTFAEMASIHRFLDFTVEQFVSDNHGCPIWGSLATGFNDELKQTRRQVLLDELTMECPRDMFGKWRLANLTFSDLSPNYSHLPDDMKGQVREQYVIAGLVDNEVGYRSG